MESVSVVAGSKGSIAARNLPRGEMRPDIANARTFAGTPSIRSPGMLCMPLCQIEAWASVGDVIDDPRPSSDASCVAHGTRARNASGPSSIDKPANGVVRIRPPTVESASRTVTLTGSVELVRTVSALVSPATPAPMMTT